MRKCILAISLSTLLFACAKSDPWGSAPKGNPWVKGDVKQLQINGKFVPHRVYTHPLGVHADVPEEYSTSIDANRLIVHGSGCNFEQIISALPNKDEAFQEADRWIQKTQSESSAERSREVKSGFEEAQKQLASHKSASKFDLTIPDSDPKHRYQDNLWVDSDGQRAFFYVERSCRQEGSKHSCYSARPTFE